MGLSSDHRQLVWGLFRVTSCVFDMLLGHGRTNKVDEAEESHVGDENARSLAEEGNEY